MSLDVKGFSFLKKEYKKLPHYSLITVIRQLILYIDYDLF